MFGEMPNQVAALWDGQTMNRRGCVCKNNVILAVCHICNAINSLQPLPPFLAQLFHHTAVHLCWGSEVLKLPPGFWDDPTTATATWTSATGFTPFSGWQQECKITADCFRTAQHAFANISALFGSCVHVHCMHKWRFNYVSMPIYPICLGHSLV